MFVRCIRDTSAALAFDRLLQEISPSSFYKPGARPHTTNVLTQPTLDAVETVMNWIQGSNDDTIMWLSGTAGTGKTLVSYTVADRCADDGLLAATFFFSCSDDKRSSGNKFIATLAHQISINIPECLPYIESAILSDPAVFEQPIKHQLLHIIVEPLTKFTADQGARTTPYVILFDALDECLDAVAQSSIIDAITSISQTKALPVRFILTSRPEVHIISAFDSSPNFSPTVMRLSLDDKLDNIIINTSIPSPLPDFSFASWIWTWENPYANPPVGPRPFRKTVIVPNGGFVDSLIVDITCDDIFTLYVNGLVVGSGMHWNEGRRWSITFPRTNKVVIAVYATNDPVERAWAGLLASGVMWDSSIYSGKSYYMFTTDKSWRTLATAPPMGFERLSFDDSDWPLARIEGRYGAQPWGKNVHHARAAYAIDDGFTGVMGVPDAPKAPRATSAHITEGKGVNMPPFTPDLAVAQWIWTQEVPYHDRPAGPRRFRKTFLLPEGKVVDSLVIDITCDDLYSLYINGRVLGHGLQWHIARRWSITFPPTNKIIIAVYASNDPVGMSYAGLLASAVLWDSADINGGYSKIKTDASWKYGGTSSWTGTDLTPLVEGDWKPVKVSGRYGTRPWGYIEKPSVFNPIMGGFKDIEGVPDAPEASLATGEYNLNHIDFI